MDYYTQNKVSTGYLRTDCGHDRGRLCKMFAEKLENKNKIGAVDQNIW